MNKVLFIILALAVSTAAAPSVFGAHNIHDGFAEYQIQKGDVLGKIAPDEHWDIIRKINRIDERHLPTGKKILIPVDMEKAEKFLPVPQFIASLAERKRAVCIFLDIQYFGSYENGQLIFWGPISSGRKNTATPTGEFSVIWKTKTYRSKKYDADMPFAVNISSDGYFLHEQALPGRAASHGCIRLLREDAKKIYDWIRKKDPIIISKSSGKPELFL